MISTFKGSFPDFDLPKIDDVVTVKEWQNMQGIGLKRIDNVSILIT